MTHKKYKTYTLALLLITIAALIVTAAMLSLKREAKAVQASPAGGRRIPVLLIIPQTRR